MASEADVRRICLSLPETMEKPYQGLPGFRVRDKLFARIREEPDALVVWRPDVLEKEALIASEPEKFFQIPHYEGHPAVLVRLEAVEADELQELLTESWSLRASRRLVEAFEAAHGPIPPSTSGPSPLDGAVLVVGTAMPQERIRYAEKRR